MRHNVYECVKMREARNACRMRVEWMRVNARECTWMQRKWMLRMHKNAARMQMWMNAQNAYECMRMETMYINVQECVRSEECIKMQCNATESRYPECRKCECIKMHQNASCAPGRPRAFCAHVGCTRMHKNALECRGYKNSNNAKECS